MSTDSNLPNRRSIRLKNYDYSNQGSYFITLVSQDRLHLFGKIEDGIMKLNSIGKILDEEWRKNIELRSNIALGEFIIMPDHMHMIITITNQLEKKEPKEWIHSNPKSPSHTIGAIIRGFKGASTKKINLLLISTGESQFARKESQFARKESQFARNSPQYSPIESQFSRKASQSPPIESQFSRKESQFSRKASQFPLKEPQFSSLEFTKNKIWQRNYYEHIIRDQNDYERIEKYIIDNPSNWKKKKLNLKRNN